MAKVIIQYEAETASLKASVSEINKVNDEVVKSAQDSSKKVADAYKQTGQAAAAAFASGGVKKALDEQNASISGVTAKLKLLYDEEVKLLEQGKKSTARYAENQKEAARLKAEIDKLTKTTGEQNKAIDAQNNKAKSLTGQLRAYREQLSRLEQEGKETTNEFNQIAVAAAKLEDQIGDTRERVRVLASDTFQFDAAIDATQQLAAGFSVVQGSVALFADDNEELQQAIAKTNAALAILNGLQQINAFITGQSAAKLAALNILQKINDASVRQSAISYNLLGKSIQFSATSINIFKGALAAIGVGLVIFAISELIEIFEKLSERNKQYQNSLKRTTEAIKESGKAFQQLRDIIADAETSIALSTNKITNSQAALNKEIANIRQVSKEAYAPLISAQLDLEAQIKEVNAEINRQNQIIEGNRGSTRDGAALAIARAQSALNEEIAKRTRLEQDLAKIEKEKQRISETTVNAIVAQTKATRESDLSTLREKQKKEEEERLKLIQQQRLELLKLFNEASQANAELAKSNLAEIKARQANLNSLIKRTQLEDTSAQTLLQTRLNFIDTIEIEEGTSLQKRLARIALEGDLRKAQTFDSINDAKERETAIQLITAQTQQAIRDEIKRTEQERLNTIFETAKQIANVFNQLGVLSSQLTENRISGIQEAQRVELESINNSVKTERQKQREREALELRTSRRIAQEKIKQARLDKAIALFGAVVNTAEAITKALPNVVLAGIAGVLGAAQIATIAARPIPKFEKGGAVGGKRHSSGGTLIEAEKDEFVTRRQQSIRHRAELEAINTSTANFNRLIEQRYIRPAIERYMINSARQNLTVRASLNSKSMEKELRTMRKSLGKPVIININGKDNRYTWQ